MKVTFSRSSSLANAFKAFREIIEGYYEGRTKWDPILLQSAKGSLVYSWVETQDSPEDLSSRYKIIKDILSKSGYFA